MTDEPSLIPIPVVRWSDRGPFDIIGDVYGCAYRLNPVLDVGALRAHAAPVRRLVTPV